MSAVSLVIACVLFAIAGCSATLRSDGFYGCPEPDRQCPSGFVCHASDHLCYHLPETLFDSGPTPDTGMMMMPDTGVAGPTCSPPCTAPAICAIGQWGMPPGAPTYHCISSPAAAHHGEACTPGSMPSLCSSPDVCLPGTGGTHPACMRPCDPPSGGGCFFGEDCVVVQMPVCLPPCGGGGSCPSPFVCSASLGNHCVPSGW